VSAVLYEEVFRLAAERRAARKARPTPREIAESYFKPRTTAGTFVPSLSSPSIKPMPPPIKGAPRKRVLVPRVSAVHNDR
jgi:hypothetical protein